MKNLAYTSLELKRVLMASALLVLFIGQVHAQCSDLSPTGDCDGDGLLNSEDCYYVVDGENYLIEGNLVLNSTFDYGYANFLSDFNRGRNNNKSAPATNDGCNAQGWVAVSPFNSSNGTCAVYYDYYGGTYNGSVLITDANQTGANVYNNDPSTLTTANSCQASYISNSDGSPASAAAPNNTLYIDPSNVAGKSYWVQDVAGIEELRTYIFRCFIYVVEEDPALNFIINDEVIFSSEIEAYGAGNNAGKWQEVTFLWHSSAATESARIEIANTRAGCNGNDIRLDDITFAPVARDANYNEIADCFERDTDHDGLPDVTDIDDDNDGILDVNEIDACGIVNNVLLSEDFGEASSATSGKSVNLSTYDPSATTAFGYKELDNPNTGTNLEDGNHAIFNNIQEAVDWSDLIWQTVGDHTSGIHVPTTGRMLMVNSGSVDQVVYEKTISGVTAGALIDVSFWVLNLDVYGADAATLSRKKPNVEIEVLQNGVLLGPAVTTGEVERAISGSVDAWRKYYTLEPLRAVNSSDITLRIKNKNSGQNGNDLAIDDILVTQLCDSDEDGIPNHLDTDSDNDGCPDAMEAAGAIIPSQLSTLDGGSNGGSSENLGEVSDTEGRPIVASISSDGFEQDPTDAVIDGTDKSACTADLSLIKTVDVAVPKLGSNIVYALKVTNNGSLDATGVKVTDVLPEGVSFDSVHTLPTGTTYTPGVSNVWDIGTLSTGSSMVLKITATVDGVGEIVNRAEVTGVEQEDVDSTVSNDE